MQDEFPDVIKRITGEKEYLPRQVFNVDKMSCSGKIKCHRVYPLVWKINEHQDLRQEERV